MLYRRGFIRVAVLCGIGALLASCGQSAEQFPAYRYRLTVEVDTPEGLRTGSSVIEVETNRASEDTIPTPGKVSYNLKGEAVAVDLGERGMIFALLRSEREPDWAKYVMFLLAPAPPEESEDRFADRYAAMLEMDEAIELPKAFEGYDVLFDGPRPALPMLVTFSDLSDPTSVIELHADRLGDHLGTGVRLRRITAQMTDDQVTSGIGDRLDWLSNYPEPRLDPEFRASENPNLSQRLKHGDFKRL